MTTPEPKKGRRLTWLWIALAFFIGLVAMAGIAFLLTNIQTHKNEEVEYPLKTVAIAANELDPAVWGQNFPREYDSFKKTEIDGVETPYGGSNPYDKLAKYPILKRVWAGYAFSVDFNEERGHYYALIDQKQTKRQEVVKQPAACANCHAAEAPQLIAEMGWEKFNSTPYKEISGTLHLGSSCADCHDPTTMELRITRARRIYSDGLHNAFTGVTRLGESILVCFRSATTNVTRIKEWVPFPEATHRVGQIENLVLRAKWFGPAGIRAVLWVQGEADTDDPGQLLPTPAADYERDAKAMIEFSRKQLGWPVDWFVAGNSYIPAKPGKDYRKNIADTLSAQKALWDKGIAFRGPDTNDLVGSPDYRHDGVHFGPRGLLVHAERWYAALGSHYQFANPATSQRK